MKSTICSVRVCFFFSGDIGIRGFFGDMGLSYLVLFVRLTFHTPCFFSSQQHLHLHGRVSCVSWLVLTFSFYMCTYSLVFILLRPLTTMDSGDESHLLEYYCKLGNYSYHRIMKYHMMPSIILHILCLAKTL